MTGLEVLGFLRSLKAQDLELELQVIAKHGSVFTLENVSEFSIVSYLTDDKTQEKRCFAVIPSTISLEPVPKGKPKLHCFDGGKV